METAQDGGDFCIIARAALQPLNGRRCADFFPGNPGADDERRKSSQPACFLRSQFYRRWRGKQEYAGNHDAAGECEESQRTTKGLLSRGERPAPEPPHNTEKDEDKENANDEDGGIQHAQDGAPNPVQPLFGLLDDFRAFNQSGLPKNQFRIADELRSDSNASRTAGPMSAPIMAPTGPATTSPTKPSAKAACMEGLMVRAVSLEGATAGLLWGITPIIADSSSACAK